MRNNDKSLDKELDQELLTRSLKQGVAERAGTLSFVLSPAYLIYGFSSYSYLRQFDPSLTLIQNLIPRVFLNFFPLILLGFYMRKKTGNPDTKILIWTYLSQLIYLFPCTFQIWQIMWKGTSEIYLYAHGVNGIYIGVCSMWIGAFPMQLVSLLIAMTLVIWVPTAYILYKVDSFQILTLLINDMLLFNGFALACGILSFQLRKKASIESIALARALNSLEISTNLEKQKSEQIVMLEKEKADALARNGLQIHHDIKNPLESLRTRIDQIEISPSRTVDIKRDVHRIEDIINALVTDTTTTNTKQLQLVVSLVGIIASEAKTLHEKNLIAIKCIFSQKSHFAFSSLVKREFLRALSNIVRNSAEAVDKNGRIVITLQLTRNQIILKIRDNGKGISSELLPFIFNSNFTYGKVASSQRGLGLSQAKAAIESIGGTINVKSAVGKGTTTTIRLHPSNPPAWFLNSITLAKNDTLVLLDDERYIHEVWDQKISKFNKLNRSNVSIIHLYNTKSFESWHESDEFKSIQESSCRYVIDLSLSNSENFSGLDLIERYEIGDSALLSTQQWEDPAVQERCLKNHIGLLPKMLLDRTNLRLGSSQPLKYDAVFIDDNLSLLDSLAKQASQTSKSILLFTSIQHFLRDSRFIHPETEIRVDSELGDGIRGEVEAKHIARQGFENIFCISYSDSLDLESYPWIKGKKQKDSL